MFGRAWIGHQDIDAAQANGALQSGANAVPERHPLRYDLWQFDQQIDVATTKLIVQARAKKKHLGLGTGQFCGDPQYRLTVVLAQSHFGSMGNARAGPAASVAA